MSDVSPATVADVLGAASSTPPPDSGSERSAVPPVQPVDCDRKGVAFDPERHLPIQHPKTGCWMPRRKPAASGSSAAPSGPPAPDAQQPAPDLSDIAAAAKGPEAARPAGPSKFTLLADVYCRGGIAIACTAISDEWRPDSDAEFVALRDAVAAWFEAEGWEDLSPRGGAFAAIGGYIASRAVRPKTLTRFQLWRASLFSWWRGRAVSRHVAAMPAPGGAR